MYSISIILPYFINGKGEWPEYIDWYFASCKANDTIDFFVFTDDKSISRWETVKNIHIFYMTFQDCCNLIKRKLGDVKISKPYKLCDYRPAYGVIFEDWIKEYDYWGWCDCDLLFGDIRKFFPDEVLTKYDKFMILGHLQLSKNNEEVNHYFCLKRPADSKYKDYTWEIVSQDEGHYGWDEWSGAPQLVRENGKSILWERETFSNIYQPIKNGKHLYDKILDKNVGANRPFQVWQWKDGGIYHIDILTKKRTPKLYIHLTERKMKVIPYTSQNEIYITENSEFKDKISFRDTIAGWDFIRLFTKKVFIWVKWHLTHLKGKKSWEL